MAQFQLSSTTVSDVESFTDYGTNVKQGTTQTHHLTLYKAPSGALVFGAGTVQWAWGLDTTNAWNANGPLPGTSPDPVMQQATVNLFADMGAPADDAHERPDGRLRSRPTRRRPTRRSRARRRARPSRTAPP